jgi:carboxymethylenebutenolidase
MKTSSIEIPVGSNHMPAYLAAPDDGTHPAVIVLQEIFGVNAEMRRITDLLASAGYVAVAINYYHRTDPQLNLPYNEEGMKIGMGAASHLSRPNMSEDLEATIAWLNQQPNVDKGRIATWGFCMGGSVAFLSATLPAIKAAISFYGGSVAGPFPSGEAPALNDVDAVRAPMLLMFGGKDKHITADKVAKIDSTLKAAGKHYELKVYADEDHGFFRQSSQALNNVNVQDAWDSVQRFLAQVV